MDSTSWFLVIVFSIMTVIMIIASIVRNRIERKMITVPEGFYHLVMSGNKVISPYAPGGKYPLREDDAIIVLEGNPSKFVLTFDDILKSSPSSPEMKYSVKAYCRIVNVRKALLQERVSANNFNIILTRAIQNKLIASLRDKFPGMLPCADTVDESVDVGLDEAGVEIISINVVCINSVKVYDTK